MRKFLKALMIVLMIIGITLSILNFISVDNVAGDDPFPKRKDIGGTSQSNGLCLGEPTNC